ncbi:MAG: TRAP transporter substrate-binding protein [Ramlibacter sp.]|nr:TRAP transporter substrate-binding protein [Ramlibacter sp.]
MKFPAVVRHALCSFALIAAVAAQAQTRWDMPTAYPVANFHTENVQYFSDEVARRSGGKLKINLHPNASLFKANEIKRAVQTGQTQIGEILLSGFANENPLYGVDSIPFLADSYSKARKLAEVSRPAIEKLLAAQGMKLLYTVPWQGQSLYSKKPVQVPADLRGTKMRAYNPATSRIAVLLGAQPTTVQLAEVSQALATGMVENLLNSSSGGVDARFYEHLSHLYTVNAWYPKNAVIVSSRYFDALDPALQKAVTDAAAAAEEKGWRVSQEKDAQNLKVLADKGMKIQPPTPELAAALKVIGEKMADEWQQAVGSDGAALLAAFRK